MKKNIMAAVIVAVFAGVIFAGEEFTLTGMVNDAGGGYGNASTPNSFGYLNAYRIGIPAQVGKQDNGEEIFPCVSPNKIFASDGSIPAYYMSDIGSTYWEAKAISMGQVTRVVIEVSPTGNCYTGMESYVGVTTVALDNVDIFTRKKNVPDITVAVIPWPLIVARTASSITVGWTGIDRENIYGYGVYRTETGTGIPVRIGEALQDRANAVQYTDSGASLDPLKYYTYAISVEFEWGGGNGAPDYFETNVRSRQSVQTGLDVPTLTCTGTPTQGTSLTATMTYTAAMSVTNTHTMTVTLSHTNTVTPAYTATVTMTLTDTATLTPTVTPEPTGTSVIPAATATNTRIEAQLALTTEKLIIMNNPVRNSVLKAGYLSPENGAAVIVLYNLNGQIAKRFTVPCDKGANILEKNIYGVPPGVYVVRINAAGENLPARKLGIIK